MKVRKPKYKFNSVMLVDDNEIDNFINEKMIEGTQIAKNIFVHSSGKSALEFLQNLSRAGSHASGIFPDVIFLDLNMPIMDGFQFLNSFREMSLADKDKVRIVILTSSLNPVDKETAKKHHVTMFVNKPLTEESLEQLTSL